MTKPEKPIGLHLETPDSKVGKPDTSKEKNFENHREQLSKVLERSFEILEKSLNNQSLDLTEEQKSVINWAIKTAKSAKEQSFDVGKNTYPVVIQDEKGNILSQRPNGEGIPVERLISGLRLLLYKQEKIKKETSPLINAINSAQEFVEAYKINPDAQFPKNEVLTKAAKDKYLEFLSADNKPGGLHHADIDENGNYNNDRHLSQTKEAWLQVLNDFAQKEKPVSYKPMASDFELQDLMRDLENNSQDYFEYHYGLKNGVGLDDPKNQEQQGEQHEYTKREAYYLAQPENEGLKKILKELRLKDGDLPDNFEQLPKEEQDYALAMLELRDRQLLVIKEDKTTPEVIKLPTKLTSVDATELVELQAAKAGETRFDREFYAAGFFKKSWMRSREQMYRDKFIAEEKDRILGITRTTTRDKSQRGWRNLFLGKKIETISQSEKNLFSDPEKKAEHDREMQSLLERFQESYLEAAGKEAKNRLTDPEHAQEITNLIKEYATGDMADEDFTKRKEAIVSVVKEKHPEFFLNNELSVDSFLEAARQYRKAMAHDAKLLDADINFEIDFGIARKAIKTEAHKTWTDKIVEKMQRSRLGSAFTPATVATAVSIANYFVRKPLAMLGGSVGLGALLGYFRRSNEVNKDRATHAMERAMGRVSANERRQTMRELYDKIIQNQKPVTEIIDDIASAHLNIQEAGEMNPELMQQLAQALAEAEARMSLGEEAAQDFIRFESEYSLENNRLQLLKTIAEGKVFLQNNSNLNYAQFFDQRKNTLRIEMEEKDKEATKFRRSESRKAAVIGAATGFVVGGITQQGAALLGDQIQNLSWLRPGGLATSLEQLANSTQEYFTGTKGTWGPEAALRSLTEQFSLPIEGLAGETQVQIPEGTQLIPSLTEPGKFSLVDENSKSILGSFLLDQQTGKFSPIEINDPNLELRVGSLGITDGEGAGLDYQMAEVDRWYSNDTTKFDLNELRGIYGGVGNGGFSTDGKSFEFDLNYLKEGQSFVGEHKPNLNQLMSEGKLKIMIIPEAGPGGPDYNIANNAVFLDIDPSTNKVITTDPNILAMFEKNSNGETIFHGSRWHIVEMLGVGDNGQEKVASVATVIGKNDFVPPDPVDSSFNIFSYKDTPGWELLPHIPISSRRILEPLVPGTERQSSDNPNKDNQGSGSETEDPNTPGENPTTPETPSKITPETPTPASPETKSLLTNESVMAELDKFTPEEQDLILERLNKYINLDDSALKYAETKNGKAFFTSLFTFLLKDLPSRVTKENYKIQFTDSSKPRDLGLKGEKLIVLNVRTRQLSWKNRLQGALRKANEDKLAPTPNPETPEIPETPEDKEAQKTGEYPKWVDGDEKKMQLWDRIFKPSDDPSELYLMSVLDKDEFGYYKQMFASLESDSDFEIENLKPHLIPLFETIENQRLDQSEVREQIPYTGLYIKIVELLSKDQEQKDALNKLWNNIEEKVEKQRRVVS